VRTKWTSFYGSVCINVFRNVCITVTWLNDTFCSHNLFPDNCVVVLADTVFGDSNVTRGCGTVTGVFRSFPGWKLRYDPELPDVSVWIEIFIPDDFRLFVGSHYFPPSTDAKVTENNFCSLETNFNPQNLHTVLLGDFNIPGYDWVNGFPQAKSRYNNKFRGGVSHNTVRCLWTFTV
jgi:hypothetical protein